MVEIKGFLETSFVDWPGKICSVFFLPTCNFRCPYCHNHPLVLHPEQYRSVPLEDALERLHALEGWVDGICVTGGEPTLHPDLPDLIHKLRDHGFLVKLDTNGSNPAMLEALVEVKEIDFISMDVKAPLDAVSYRRSVGIPVDLTPLLKSIDVLRKGKVEYEFRMTVVPGLHCEEDVTSLASQLRAGRRFVLQNFNPENPLDPRLKNTPPYDPEVLKRMEKNVQAMG